jgi:hypothetical protein
MAVLQVLPGHCIRSVVFWSLVSSNIMRVLLIWSGCAGFIGSDVREVDVNRIFSVLWMDCHVSCCPEGVTLTGILSRFL